MTRWNRKKTYTALVRPHIAAMYRAAWRWTRNRETAEDLVQDVLVKLIDRIDEMRQVEQLRPWLIKIVYRCCVDYYRRESRSPVTAGEGIDAAVDGYDPVELTARQQLLSAGLERLEPGQRDVILLHDVEGYTAVEVAEILEISAGTVKSRLHRGRRRLKKFIDEGTF